MLQLHTIYEFNDKSNRDEWIVVDDVVMGGLSSGNFYINEQGKGVFEGQVSLENNGGFSSVRHRLNKTGIKPYSKLILRVKGDGKKYQFRIKDKTSNYYAYVSYFKTSKDWETIELPLKNMYATFRGRKLNIPNYNKNTIEEIAFLIANKKAENFKLEIDYVDLE